jgi:hypothetical protein
MNRLFIELYLDADVDPLIAKLVRHHGFRAVTAGEVHRLKDEDPDQLSFASAKGWTILTHNRGDFEALGQEYFKTGRRHPGIIIAVRRKPHAIAGRVLKLLNDVSAEEMQDQVRYI